MHLDPSALLVLLAAVAPATPPPAAPAAEPVGEKGTAMSVATVPAASGPACTPDMRPMVAKILPSNVRVLVLEGGEATRSASGVAFYSERTSKGPVTYVLTNAHVADPKDLKNVAHLVLVDPPMGETQQFRASVVASGAVPENDLAVLAVPSVSLELAPIGADEDVTIGENVLVVSAPFGRALSVTSGLVSQIERKSQSRLPQLLKTDAAIGYGASGGGVFSALSGRLLGIVEGYRTAQVRIPTGGEGFTFDVPMPGETFAASAAKIRHFLSEKGLTRMLQPARSASR